jgi:pimeloyl-ACP methyl ester carboxylesterase
LKVSLNGAELAYDDHGVGLPILFLHAFPLNRNMWTELTGALLNEQQFRLITLDWRGFGESSIKALTSPMSLFADDVAALMDHLGIQKAILCGLSMGGYVSFAFMHSHPERVYALILADTRPGADNEEGKQNREKLALMAESQGVDVVADTQVPRLLSQNTFQHHPEVEARVRQMISMATPAGVAAASRGMAQRADSSELLAKITCPTLVIVGEQDALIPPELAQGFAQQIPGAQFAVISQAGHLSVLEQPDAFLQTVRNFLAQLA